MTIETVLGGELPRPALCQCVGEEDERPLCIRIMPSGDGKICCDECGSPVIDDEPQTWRDLADAAILDLRHYADDETPHRRLVSARAYEARFALLDQLAALARSSVELGGDNNG